jgi:hypothetical protein
MWGSIKGSFVIGNVLMHGFIRMVILGDAH